MLCGKLQIRKVESVLLCVWKINVKFDLSCKRMMDLEDGLMKSKRTIEAMVEVDHQGDRRKRAVATKR